MNCPRCGHIVDESATGVLKLRAACARLGISLRTAQRMLRAKTFPIPEVVGVSGHHLFRVSDIDRFLESRGAAQLSGPSQRRGRTVRNVHGLKVVGGVR